MSIQIEAGEMPHVPGRLSNEVYGEVQRNVPVACTDAYLYNPESDAVFLGDRAAEPQLGAWPIGGRIDYGKSPEASAAKHVMHDFGLELGAADFTTIGVVSTPFPIAGPKPGDETFGRHTVNVISFASLKPEQVAAINDQVESGNISPENRGGKWVSVDEIREPDSPFPFAVREAMRDLRRHQREIRLDQEEAQEEDRLRQGGWRTALEIERGKRIAAAREGLSQIGISNGESFPVQDLLIDTSGRYAVDAAAWMLHATDAIEAGTASVQDRAALREELTGMLYEDGNPTPKLGDYHRRKRLEVLGLPPVVAADNGVVQRAVLDGALFLLSLEDMGDEGQSVLENLQAHRNALPETQSRAA